MKKKEYLYELEDVLGISCENTQYSTLDRIELFASFDISQHENLWKYSIFITAFDVWKCNTYWEHKYLLLMLNKMFDYEDNAVVDFSTSPNVIWDALVGTNLSFIRCNCVLLINKNYRITRTLAFFCLMIEELVGQKPSIIADACRYMTGHKPKKHDPNVFGGLCKIIWENLDMVRKNIGGDPYSKIMSQKCDFLLDHISEKCPDHGILQGKTIKIIRESFESYRKVKKLKGNLMGEGSTGKVYKEHRKGKDYAIKISAGDVGDILPGRLMYDLGAKYIASLDGLMFNEPTQDIYLIYEAGTFTMHVAIEKKKLQFDDVSMFRYMYQIASGIKELHRADILHGDIKPDNIVWFGDRFKIIDLGLSVGFFSEYTNPTRNLFAPVYRPPELFDDVAPFGLSADIWALGLIIFFLVTKKDLHKTLPPFPLDTIMFVYRAFLSGPTYKTLTGKYRNIIDLCLQFDPSKRITANDLVDHLECALNGTQNTEIHKTIGGRKSDK